MSSEGSSTGELQVQTLDIADVKELDVPKPIQASLCRKGVFVMMKDCPCKVNELKISKTGKHGSSKANMVGYDIITNRKYQETVPGHATMFEFEPKKMEYEVVDIVDGIITAMGNDGSDKGQEKFFNLPAEEHGQKLLAEFTANAEAGGENFWIITVLFAPRGTGTADKWLANIYVESYKQGKNEE